MPEMLAFFRNSFWIAMGSLTFSVFFIWLIVTGGKNYSAEDAEAHSLEFAGLVKEGHGRMTSFLWISFIMILIWTISYIAIHFHEFAVIFTQG